MTGRPDYRWKRRTSRYAALAAIRARGVCAYCGTTEGPFTLDHVIPRSRGGTSNLTNLVCACDPCNRSKGGLVPEEWAGPPRPETGATQ